MFSLAPSVLTLVCWSAFLIQESLIWTALQQGTTSSEMKHRFCDVRLPGRMFQSGFHLFSTRQLLMLTHSAIVFWVILGLLDCYWGQRLAKGKAKVAKVAKEFGPHVRLGGMPPRPSEYGMFIGTLINLVMQQFLSMPRMDGRGLGFPFVHFFAGRSVMSKTEPSCHQHILAEDPQYFGQSTRHRQCRCQ